MGSRRRAVGPDAHPKLLPIFPLPGALLLPGGRLPLNIFEPRYLDMIDDALARQRVIGMIQPESDVEAAKPTPRLAQVGCLGRIVQFAETGDGRYLIVLEGLSRFRVAEEASVATSYRQCLADYSPFASDSDPEIGADAVDRRGLLDAFRTYASSKGIDIDWDTVDSAPTGALVNAFAALGPFGLLEKQALLEAPDLAARSSVLIAIAQFDAAHGAANTPLQ